MTLEQFGQSVKAKHPQYNDMSDAELGQKMLTKYPQYQNMITGGVETATQPTQDTQQPQQDLLSKLAGVGNSILGFTGGKNIAEIGGSLLSGQSLPQALRTQGGGSLGSGIAKTAGDVGQLTSLFAPGAVGASKAVTGLGRIASTGATLGTISGIAGGSRALSEGGNASDVASSAIKTGAVGVGLGVAGQSIAELSKYLTSPSVTEGIYNKYLGIPKKVVEKGRSPAGMLINEGVGGTKSAILNKAQKIATGSDKQIADILAKNTGTVNSANVLSQIKQNLQEKFSNSLSSSEIDAIVDKLPLNALRTKQTISYETLNSLRQEIANKFLGNGKWLNDSTAERILGLKTASGVMSDIVKSTDERLIPIFSRYSDAITTVKALRSDLAKPHVMSNLLEILGSLVYGGATGGLSPEGVKNALGAFGVAKGVTSAPVGTGVARGLNALGKTGNTVGTVMRTAVPLVAKESTGK